MDDEREPGFFTGLNSSDFVGIGIALMFSVGGLYLIWRMLFGPPLFEPVIQAIQGQIKAIQSSEKPIANTVHTGPGEVVVGISPRPDNKKKH